MEGYQTVWAEATASFVEKKSEFIGHIAPVESSEQASDFITRIRAENRKANHNVSAYILRAGNIGKSSDDGEPQGTGGVPIFQVIKREGLVDVCCVVTRYFGGILLGASGLIRAYTQGAAMAVEAADRRVLKVAREINLTLSYDLYGKVAFLLEQFPVKILKSDFLEQVEMTVLSPVDVSEALKKNIIDVCNGKVDMVISDEKYADF